MSTVVAVLSEGLVILRHEDDEALWARCKTRKPFRDAAGGGTYPAGTDAFRPVGNQAYRSHRIAAATVQALIDRQNSGAS